MIELSDVEINLKKYPEKNIVSFNGNFTNSIELTTELCNLENNEDYSEQELIDDTLKTMKEEFITNVYGEVSDEVVRIAQRVMKEVKDPAVSADIYADLEVLYKKLNKHKSDTDDN